jgi:hypothetical protein
MAKYYFLRGNGKYYDITVLHDKGDDVYHREKNKWINPASSKVQFTGNT